MELCLHEVFESQVEKTPDVIALQCGDCNFTYAELDRKASQLAHRLRQLGSGPSEECHMSTNGHGQALPRHSQGSERGGQDAHVGPGQFVAIYFERSELPIIAILACLKSGAAYVPIDPSYPSDRIQHIIEESGLLCCLTERALSPQAMALFADTKLVVLDDEWLSLGPRSSSRLHRQETGGSPQDLAYVIYTSGTTGRPKGVMAEHRHVTRFVEAFNEVCATGPGDRVYQGFSLSFDGSVEEMWMAFSNGSTLVVPARDAPRFGNELAQYLTELGITYFSTVPTLLSTLTNRPPTLRTLVLSGEVCSPKLVDLWSRPGLRILNVYGPTEATVNTTVATCVPGRPVTIGRPLRGYGIHIVDENLRPVPSGVKGELLISSETLARGYLKQPELTRERFFTASNIDQEGTKRYYRTGDLVRWNKQGELEFFGRIDSQVKIRGYRVELAEIEFILQEHPQIRSACVRLFERAGLQELAAYVVLRKQSAELDREELLSQLESRVPPYMIPGYLDIVAELPRTTSGKVDRKQLPAPHNPLVRISKTFVLPRGDLERVIADVWTEILGVSPVSAGDDFFLDLGGHSLVAARMVTLLRERISHPVTIRDVYQFPTIRRLAGHIKATTARIEEPVALVAHNKESKASSRTVFESTPRLERVTTWALQALSIYVVSGIVMLPLVILFLFGLGWVLHPVSTGRLIGLIVLLALLTWPTFLAFSIGAKWVLIGRYKPGEYKLWSFYYWRWWLVNKIVSLSGAAALSGTPLLPLYYRLMGARVGARCALDTVQCSAWDLITIGDDTSIGADTQILGYRVERGMLRLGHINIGSRCFIGIHSALGLDVQMGNDSSLDDQSLLPDLEAIPPSEGRRGSPAQRANVHLPAGSAPQSHWRRAVFALAHLVAVEVMGVIMLLPGFLFLYLYWLAFSRAGLIMGISAMIVSVPVSVIFYCVYIAGLKRLILSRIKPGTYQVLSLIYLRKWLSDRLMTLSRGLLLPVYTTLYLPPLLRLMGSKIGPRAEISTVWSFAPELIDVGAESFFADGSIIGGRRCHRGQFEVAVNRIGYRSFVGNSAILPTGHSLGDNCLLGVQSIPPLETPCVPNGTEWLGSPSFALTHRAKVGNFDKTVTFQPTFRLYFQRAIIDGLRILIPGYLALSALTIFVITLFLLYQRAGTGVMLATAPIVELTVGFSTVLVVAGLKKAVMGTYKPEIKPLWSMYVWLNEMINGAYESVAAPVLAPLLGTPFVAPFLRLMGCRIGRYTYIGTTLFSEFDLVEIGDYAALNHGVVIQNHLFEDRVFKSSSLHIGHEVSIGNMSVILYDTKIERGAFIGPLSLLMKGETLRQDTQWYGIPTILQVSDHTALPTGHQITTLESVTTTLIPSGTLTFCR